MNFFLGLLFVVIGGFATYYSRSFEKWFGRWGWAENYLGGTAQGIVVISFLLIVVGFMAMFGVVNLAK